MHSYNKVAKRIAYYMTLDKDCDMKRNLNITNKNKVACPNYG